MARLAELPPLSLYIHIPWCLKKCPYCDFNSHEMRTPSPLGEGRGEGPQLPESEYVDALIADVESSVPNVYGRKLHTIFIGGGTPSLFAPASIDRLLTAVRTRLPVDPDAEITMEANPGTFELERFRGFRAAGVNRLSIGVQSFDDRMLAAIGRVHGADEARRAVDGALEIFPTVNVDVMYALPGQSLGQALADVREAVRMGPAHVSAYHLTLEPDTHFHRFPPELPADDVAADMQEGIEELLAQAGYGHYETSAFARPGHRARHNVNYWSFGDYLGIGAGAHGKLSFRDRILREVRQRKPLTYLRSALNPHPDPTTLTPTLSQGRGGNREGEPGGGRDARRGRRGAAVRIHAECVAPDRRISRDALRAAHRASDHHRGAATRRGRGRGLDRARPRAHRADA
jgi:putative oxygen-independent coproporphyrinogen III oxidase